MRIDTDIAGAVTDASVSRADFVEAMSWAANGVNVVTTASAGQRFGLTVSAATSVTAEPPTLLACVHHESPTAQAVLDSRVMCVNVLAESQRAVAQIFAGVDQDRERRFESGGWSELRTGAPVLDGALACFDCQVVSTPRIGTHFVFIALVVATRVSDGAPLIYTRRDYARLDRNG